MGLFNKKRPKLAMPTEKLELPEISNQRNNQGLPEMPQVPDLTPADNRFSGTSLPRFPTNGMGDKLGQDIIKSAVDYDKPRNLAISSPEMMGKPETRGIPQQARRIEIQDTYPKNYNAIASPEIKENSKTQNQRTSTIPIETHNELAHASPPYPNNIPTIPIEQNTVIHERRGPIFVKIDSFERASKNFDKIRKQISEMDSILRGIKEKRAKEEAELNKWEREVESIKQKLSRIDNEILNKVD